MQLVYSLLLLCSAVALLVQGTVSSKAIFTGVDQTKSGASSVDIFRNPSNHASAAASIIKFSAQSSNFNPKENGLEVSSEAYENFFKKVSTFPGSVLTLQQSPQLDLTGDLEQFKKQIAENYSPLSDDAEDVAAAFIEQISKPTSEGASGTWLLGLITIHGEEYSERITFDLSSIEVAVTVGAKGAIKVEKQTARLQQSSFTLNSQFIVSYADTLAQRISTIDINTYEDALTTSASNDDELNAWLCGFPSKSVSRRQRLYSLSQLRMDY